MFSPQRANGRRAQVSSTASLPAPVGGWNARDPIASMKEEDALILTNIFPTEGDVMLRRGSSDHATGMTGVVETIASYEASGGGNKIFAAVGTNIYDVTSAGAVGAAVVSSQSNARFQWVNFQTSAGSYLYMVNGADEPNLYTGSAWVAVDGSSTPAITGVTTTTLINVHAHMRRLWFVEANSTSIWYLGVDSIGGAATELDFGPLFPNGGYLMAMGSWTLDAGDGMDDYAAFVSSEGDVVIYRGIDPANAADWVLVGVFHAAPPIGRRCFAKWGGDLLLISKEGLVPLSQWISRTNSRAALTDKISGAISAAVSANSALYGWQVIPFTDENMILLNVPTSSTTAEQYVMNTSTGAWCKFAGWDAACFTVHRGALYYGTTNKVVKAWTGTNDNSADIRGQGLQAFSYFKSRTQNKLFTLVRPIITADNGVGVLLGLNTDFDTTIPSGTPTYSSSDTSVWDTAEWDESAWGGSASVKKDWQTAGGVGYSGAVHMIMSSNAAEARWIATDFAWKPGEVI